MIFMLTALWALTHRYNGFARDGELYAVQAMARINAPLVHDLYLQNSSQDRYTVFSPIYASFIRVLGLQRAELVLFALCTAAFLAAAWMLVSKLATASLAWLTVGLLIITIGYYGAYQIFSYSENYLTARSAGEALVVTALACYAHDRKLIAVCCALGALFVHPLMALPGALLLICWELPRSKAILAAVCGLTFTLALALAARYMNPPPFLAAMDPEWLEVVRERSQFLFLQYWGLTDWEVAARPFVCLTLTALVVTDTRIKKLSVAAMIVGGAGLGVALISSEISPVAILLQGQAWRWMWVTGCAAILLLVPTLAALLKDRQSGPLCVVLLVLAWTYSGIDGLASAAAALALCLLRSHIRPPIGRYLRWAAAGVVAVILVWMLATWWAFTSAPNPETGRESLLIARAREIFGLGVSAAVLTGLCWYWIDSARPGWMMVVVTVAMLSVTVWVLPGSMRQLEPVGTQAEYDEFADWRGAMSSTSTVLVVPTRKSAAFMWFTLRRPSYLTVDQSSGVVFSRETSLEIKRRSDVLAPLGAAPDWKILSQIADERRRRLTENSRPPADSTAQPLTRDTFAAICSDPVLSFVIAKDDLGFKALRHRHAGRWHDWNLYDCQEVRTSVTK